MWKLEMPLEIKSRLFIFTIEIGRGKIGKIAAKRLSQVSIVFKIAFLMVNMLGNDFGNE